MTRRMNRAPIKSPGARFPRTEFECRHHMAAISLSGLRPKDRLGCRRTRDASSGGVATATLRFAAAYRAAIGRVRTARSSKSSALRADSSLSGIPSPIRFTPFPIPLGGPNRYHVGCPEGVFRATSATP